MAAAGGTTAGNFFRSSTLLGGAGASTGALALASGADADSSTDPTAPLLLPLTDG